jgi:hypothetical protein
MCALVCSRVSFFTFRWPIRAVVPKLPQYHVMLITSVEILASLITLAIIVLINYM